MTPPVPALELRGVRAGYGRIEVLHGVDLVVPPGGVFALLGPNGAGKTTTLKVLGGRVAATSGCVHVGGFHVNRARPAAIAKAGVCSIPEGRGVFPNLTVAENLMMMSYRGRPVDAIEEEAYARFPVLGTRRAQLAGTLSGGEQQMLALGRCLIAGPRLLLVDELSLGLAPTVLQELVGLVRDVARRGVTVLLVEQSLNVALDLAEHAWFMEKGEIRFSGPTAELVERGDLVRSVFLGDQVEAS